jgi:hypothetical protein
VDEERLPEILVQRRGIMRNMTSQFRRRAAFPLVLLALAGTGAFAAVPVVTADNYWLPVTDAEIQMKAPVVDPKAGIEALFTRVHVADGYNSAYYRTSVHYVRLKVFTQEGKDKAANFDIPYDKDATISSIAGRTIKPDGTILELSKDAIHDRVTVKLGGMKRMSKSFAMPGVEVGSIIEYRWREISEGLNIRYLRLQFQDEFPVERATVFVRPLTKEYVSGEMAVRPFNCKPSPMKLENDGFNSVTLTNVPAFREEPMMPGEPNVRPWVLVYYDEGENRKDADKYWADVAKKEYSEIRESMKTSGELKQAALEAVAGATDDNDKAVRLVRWIHSHVRDLWSHQVSDEERAALLKKRPKDRYRTSVEVFKSGIGSANEMNTLFAALSTEVGLNARPVMVANREDVTFDKRMVESLFLRSIDMGVFVGGQWKLYDVSARLLPPGMLSWREEAVPALVTDPKKPEFIISPVSKPADSQSARTAKLALTEDGTLEGDVSETWTGHAAEQRRQNLDGESAERQQESTKDEIVKVYPQAELTALRLENADNPEKPLELSYHIRIPNYAARTGKRILLQPLYFQRGEAPVFANADREYPVVFPYGWQETDNVTIQLPAGFPLEKPESPGELAFGRPGSYKVTMSTGKSKLIYTREFTFGNDGLIAYTREGYPQLKRIFDEIHRRDEITLSLRQVAPAGGTQ